jgi:aromatic-L-amino-acid decarboxylase
MTKFDEAEVYQLKEMLAKIGHSLDQFVNYEHVDPLQADVDWRAKLDEMLPETGIGFDSTTKLLCENVIPYGSCVGSPGFTGYITTGPTSIAVGAVTAAQIAAPQRQTLHAFNFLENLSLQWLCELLGINPSYQGIYNSGGSVANLVGLGAARQFAFEQLGIDPAATGVTQRAVIYASGESHHTIKRSAGVLGIGRDNVVVIESDQMGRMVPSALEAQIKKDNANKVLALAIVANAGTTNTGAIDPIQTLGEIAKTNNIWYHIDGSYGLPGILDERIAEHYNGLELADSLIVDPHKWLGAGVGIAATFVKDKDLLYRAFTQEHAEYLDGSVSYDDVEHSMDNFGVPYFNLGTEMSSPSRGIVVWAMLKEIGRQGMKDRIVRHNDMAKQVARMAEAHPNLELLLEPTLSICCFRFVSTQMDDLDELNRRIHRQLIRGNMHMPSTTLVEGKLALRPCFIGARTSFNYAEELVDEVLRIGNDLVNEIRN